MSKFLKKDEIKFLKSFGHAISIKRRDLKITQEQMAKMVRLSKTQIHRIETGQHPTSIITLRRISQVIGINLSDLFEEI
jgi:transcriptional regulator with XRE-family HTH domain